MAANTSSVVIWFRMAVFIIAIGFWFYQFTVAPLNSFGWQFRYLTIWGLTLNVVVAWLMLRYALGISQRSWNSVVSAVVVVNAIVVFLHWKLWMMDPALVNTGGHISWYQLYYLNGVSQMVMWFDAFFILGVFRHFYRTICLTLTILLSYIAWTEILVAPLNATPGGSQTSGLPYPFLNDMGFEERIAFYAVTIGTALGFALIGVILSRMVTRLRGDKLSPG